MTETLSYEHKKNNLSWVLDANRVPCVMSTCSSYPNEMLTYKFDTIETHPILPDTIFLKRKHTLFPLNSLFYLFILLSKCLYETSTFPTLGRVKSK